MFSGVRTLRGEVLGGIISVFLLLTAFSTARR
jgi:hypothetical protein